VGSCLPLYPVLSAFPNVQVLVGVPLGRWRQKPPLQLGSIHEPECPAPLPLQPIQDHPLLLNDTRLPALKSDLAQHLEGKLAGTDSAVVIVLHAGQTLLEWTHGRIRSNVTAEKDARQVDADTIWRVASITKVRPPIDETNEVFTILEAIIQESKGTLSLTDDIRDYLPTFTLHDNKPDRVPLRALGSHLSGLGRDSKPPPPRASR
jgi:CubicO group peptidase (beta-lactamase class C family)